MSEIRVIKSTEGLNFGKIMDYRMSRGIMPVVCIDIERLNTNGLDALRMMAFVTKEAVETTFDTGLATFWSRTQNALWTKGLTSGNIMPVRAVYADCDMDSLIYDVNATRPTCHSGEQTCFLRPTSEITYNGGLDGTINTTL